MKKNTLILVVALVAVLIVALLVAQQRPSDNRKRDNKTTDLNTPADKDRVVKGDLQSILKAFPESFPVEAGAQQKDSFKYIPANSLEQQSTVEYVSQKSLAENGKIFREYLNSASFKIINKIEKPNLLFYYATREGNDLSVKIEAINQGVIVSATYLKR